jgi:transcriptional regulator with XRE-family HTH domain
VGETIRTYRKRANLTQEKLAERADLHHNFIGEVERGNMEISLGSLLKIAKALACIFHKSPKFSRPTRVCG